MTEEDIHKRIQFFLDYYHWSVYKLAKSSGLSYSSLNNIFNRRTCPSIPTLEKICSGFGISLAEFFDFKKNPAKSENLSDDEQGLLNCYRTLSRRDKELLRAYLQGLCKQ